MKKNEELPIYEVRGNHCVGAENGNMISEISFRRIKNFLRKD